MFLLHLQVETKENEPDNRVRDEIQMVYRQDPSADVSSAFLNLVAGGVLCQPRLRRRRVWQLGMYVSFKPFALITHLVLTLLLGPLQVSGRYF